MKQFNTPVYGVLVVFGSFKDKDFRNAYVGAGGELDNITDGSCAGFTDVLGDSNTVFIAVNRLSDKSTVVHELVHAADAILRNCGIKPHSNNSEPLAYLVSALWEEIYPSSK